MKLINRGIAEHHLNHYYLSDLYCNGAFPDKPALASGFHCNFFFHLFRKRIFRDKWQRRTCPRSPVV